MGDIEDEGAPSEESGDSETTVASVIAEARYDLRDSSSLQWASAELLAYLNRALRQLDNALAAQKSDWVHQEDTSIDLAEDANFADIPSRCISIREVWIGSDQLRKQDYAFVEHKRQFSSEGQPYYWAHKGANIIFERDADQAYDLEVYFDQRHTALTLGGNMPYQSEFDDALRQMMIFQAQKRQEMGLDVDAYMFNFFMSSAMSNVVRRNYKPRRYNLGF